MKLFNYLLLISLIGCSTYKYHQKLEIVRFEELPKKMFASPSSSFLELRKKLYFLKKADSNSLYVTSAHYEKMFININKTEILIHDPKSKNYYSPSFKLFKEESEFYLIDQSQKHLSIIKLSSETSTSDSLIFDKLDASILFSKINISKELYEGDLVCTPEIALRVPRICKKPTQVDK
jgi:hypothetical protein